MAEAIVGPLLSKLQEVVLSEAKALAGVSNDIHSLRDRLMWLHAFTHETHLRSRHDGSELIRVLACQTREVAYQTEDAIDQFYLRVDLSRFGKYRLARAVAGCVTALNTQFRLRHSLSRKIAAMNARLEEIIRNSEKYKIDSAAGEPLKPWRASPAVGIIPVALHDWDESDRYKLVCHEGEQELLKKKLLDQNTPPGHVICVLGESGVGKTALVGNAYEDTSIRNNFSASIWISFPQDASDSIIVQLIYEKLILDCSTLYYDTKYDLREKVEQHRPYIEYRASVDDMLQRERYLVVIDSPITSTKWNKVRPKLPKGERGSKIVLITTSSLHGSTNDIIELNRLDDNKSEELFYSKVGMQKGTPCASAPQIDILQNVKEVTRGVPLAVVLLAKLLKTMEYDQWDRAFKYISVSNEQADRFRTILALSFDDLSDELKSCLLYFADFPENTVINAHQLVRLWMAEGFLSTKEGMDEVEQLGQDYLKELIARGLVQLVKKSVHGDVELVAIHNLVQAFLRLEAQHTCFMEVHYGSNARAPANVRRLSLQNYNDKLPALTNRLSTLRSLLCNLKEDYTQEEQPVQSAVSCMACTQGPMEESSEKHSKLNLPKLLQGSPFLRVIDLEGVDIGKELPKRIGNMVHLQYLGIRCRSLERVPSSIRNLINLQTLDVRETGIRKLPNPFWKIRTLRHVLGDELQFPMSTGDLKLLQTLETVTVKYIDTIFGAILRKLIGLRFLHVVGLKDTHKQALQDALNELTFLESLTLSGDVIQMDFTSTSLEHLKYIELDGELVLPQGYTTSTDSPCVSPCGTDKQIYLLNLTHLVLKSTRVDQSFIDMIALLPVLANLILLNESYVGDVLVLRSDGFNCLRLLKVCRLDKLKKILIESDMQKLVSIQLVDVPNLQTEAPDKHGFDKKIERCTSRFYDYGGNK